jgi:hypothetical protein
VLMHTLSRAQNPESGVRTHKEGVACESVCGPPNLESVAAIHREAPTIPLDPPGNGPDVTQIKKIRQHKSKIFCNCNFAMHLRGREKDTDSSKRRTITQTKDIQELACACKDLW